MSEDKILSLSLDEIIKLKRASSNAAGSRTPNKFRKPNDGTRGRIAANMRRGKVSSRTSLNRNSRRGGVRLQVSYRNLRGLSRARGFRAQQRSRTPRNFDSNVQRQFNIALARSRLQMAKRFLNSRQRGIPRRTMGQGVQQRRMLARGLGQRVKRGRGSHRGSSGLLNSYRSRQLQRLSLINAYRNKVNRSRGAAMRNQSQSAPSLIVSIENERATSSVLVGNVQGTRRGAGGRRGSWNRQSDSTMRSPNAAYQRSNALPYHTGALNPHIQRMIADIQGKSNSVGNGSVANSFPRRGGGVARGYGVGRSRGFGRGHLSRRQPSGNSISRLDLGVPVGTRCTLNERFGGRM